MPDFDDYQHQRRIIRRPSTKLIEKDGYVILGPDFAEIVKKFTAFVFVSEIGVMGAIAICTVLWFLDILQGFGVLIVLILAFGLIQFGQVVGLALVMRHKFKKHSRFTLHPEGEMTVKDEKYNDITLEPDLNIDFVCTADFDHKGRDIYDIALKHVSGTYYLLSGCDRNEMEKLCAELKKACSG